MLRADPPTLLSLVEKNKENNQEKGSSLEEPLQSFEKKE